MISWFLADVSPGVIVSWFTAEKKFLYSCEYPLSVNSSRYVNVISEMLEHIVTALGS